MTEIASQIMKKTEIGVWCLTQSKKTNNNEEDTSSHTVDEGGLSAKNYL